MSDTNGQIAQSWKILGDAYGKKSLAKALSIVSDKQKNIVSAFNEIISGYVKDVHGQATTDDKYVYIVDLILKRVKDVLDEKMSNLSSTSLDELFGVLQEQIEGIQLPSEHSISKESLDDLSSKLNEIIKLEIEQANEKLKTDIESLLTSFNSDISSLIEKNNESVQSDTEKNEKENLEKDKLNDNELQQDNHEDVEQKDSVEKEVVEEKEEIHIVNIDENKANDEKNKQKDTEKDVKKKEKTKKPKNTKKDKKANSDVSKKLDKLNKHFNKHCKVAEKQINLAIKQIINITNALGKCLQMAGIAVNSTIQSPKDKKKDKQDDAIRNQMYKNTANIYDALDKLAKFTDNFIDFLVSNVKRFLDGIFKPTCAFFLKVFTFIMLPIMLLIGTFVYLLAEPVNEIISPLFDNLTKIVTSVISTIETIIKEVIGPMVDFIVKTIGPPLSEFLSNVVDILVVVLEAFKPYVVQIVEGLVIFIDSVLEVLISFMNGISTGAFLLGQKLVEFATEVVDALASFMRGIGQNAEEIGQKFGRFAVEVVDTLALFMSGIGEKAKEVGKALVDFAIEVLGVLKDFVAGIGTQGEEVGKAFAKVVIALSGVVASLASFISACVDTLISLLPVVADFFRGIGTQAFEIGKLFGELIVEVVGVLIEFVKGFSENALEIGKVMGSVLLNLLKIVLAMIVAIRKWLGDNVVDVKKSDDVVNQLVYMYVHIGAMKEALWNVKDFIRDDINKTIKHVDDSLNKNIKISVKSIENLLDVVNEDKDKKKTTWYGREIDEKKLGPLGEIFDLKENFKLLPRIEEILVNIFNRIDDFINYLITNGNIEQDITVKVSKPNIEVINNLNSDVGNASDTIQQAEQQDTNANNEENDVVKIIENIGKTLEYLYKTSQINKNFTQEKYDNIVDLLNKQSNVLPLPVIGGGNNYRNYASLES